MSTVDLDKSSGEFIELLKTFTKDTTINDVKSLMGKSLFLLYDKKDDVTGKRDGKFNDAEWNAFEQFRDTILDSYRQFAEKLSAKQSKNSKTLINQDAVEYYQKEVEKIEKIVTQLEEYGQELLETNHFEELGKYEEEHNLIFKGLKEGETNPEGTLLLENVEPFEIGIPNEELQTHEGIYKKAYIIGFDKLNQKEQQEYIEKYNKAIEWCKKVQDLYENIIGKTIDQLQDVKIMLGASLDGTVTDKYLDKNVIKNVINAWKSKNPYLKEIESLEKQISAERIKFNPDTSKIAELQNILNGVYQLSEQWRLSFANDNNTEEEQTNKSDESTNYFQVSEEVTGMHLDEENEEAAFITGTGVNIGYNKEKFGVNTSGTIETKFLTQKKEESAETTEPQQSYKIGLSTYYNPSESVGLNQNSSICINPDFKMQNHQIGIRYKNTSFMASENIREMQVPTYNELMGTEETSEQTTYTTMFMLNQTLGKFNTGAFVQFANEGTTYYINGSYNYQKDLNKCLKLNFTPKVASSYISTTGNNADITMLNTGINGGITYKNNKTQIGIIIDENIGTQFPQVNNNLSATVSAKYKGLGFTVSNTNIYSAEMKMNKITAGIGLKGKNGELEATYSHSSNSACEGVKSNISQIIFNGKVYLDKLFKK